MKLELPVSRRFRVDGDYSILYIANPDNVLSQGQKNYLADILQVVASKAFGREVSKESIPRHAFIDQTYLLLAEVGRELIGFAGIRDNPGSLDGLTFLTGTAILPEHQGMGLGGRIFRRLLEISACHTLAFTTQSPIMYCLLRKVSKILYPEIGKYTIPSEMQNLGIQIIQNRKQRMDLGKFCPSTFVSRDLYSQCLYPQFPWCRDLQVNDFFKQNLRFEENETKDGFLLIGKIG